MAVLSPIPSTSTTASSAVEQAEQAKQKGNNHFKKKEYADSIGCYSHAHLLVPSSPIYPLNRAQAYLNLEKFADAERDCTTSLALDGKQTKAWFRRAIARRGLGQYTHAREDFATVLRLDPKMAASVKAELAKLDLEEKTVAVQKGKNGKPRMDVPKPMNAVASPRSYPIPLKMVYPVKPATASSSSSPATLPSISSPASPPPPSQLASSVSPSSMPDPTASIFPAAPRPKPSSSTSASSFAALKSAREAKGSVPSPPPEVTSVRSPPVGPSWPRPTSAHALHKTLVQIGDRQAAFDFLLTIPPRHLPTVIGASLEPALFDLLLSALEFASDEASKRKVVEALRQTSRFALVRMMTPRGEERWAKVA